MVLAATDVVVLLLHDVPAPSDAAVRPVVRGIVPKDIRIVYALVPLTRVGREELEAVPADGATRLQAVHRHMREAIVEVGCHRHANTTGDGRKSCKRLEEGRELQTAGGPLTVSLADPGLAQNLAEPGQKSSRK